MANYLYLVQGEMKAVVAILKTPSRSQWGGYIPTEDTDLLLRTFADLRDVLNSVSVLTDVNPQEYISPFLDVIIVSNPNAAAVTRSLKALKRLLDAGVIPDDGGIKIIRVSESIAKAVTQTKFFTNQIPCDDGVLLASLGIMNAIFQSPCNQFLTDESVCAILQCCFRIRFDNMNGSILHEIAEDTLANIASVMFSRLPTFNQDFRHPYMKKLLKISIGTSKLKSLAHASKSDTLPPAKEVFEESQPATKNTVVEAPVEVVEPEKPGSVSDDVEIVQQHPVTTLKIDQQIESDTNNPERSTEEQQESKVEKEEEASEIFDPDSNRNANLESAHIPYGLPSVREFLCFLAGLMDSSSDQATPDHVVLLGLRLYTTALEVGAEYIAQCNFLMKLVKDDLSYNLLKLLDSSRLSIFAAANHAWFLMISAMKNSLKFQMEKYFVKLGILIASDSLTVTTEIKEIALESLVQLFCIPNLITQLFLFYDLSYYTSDVFKDLVRILHENVFSTSGILEPRHILALDALGAIVDHFLKSIQFTRTPEESINQIPPALEHYLDCSPSERLIRKEHIRNASKAFNQKPKKGIEYLIEHKMFLLEPPPPDDIAHFLLITPNLDKKKIGLYLCERENSEILPAFIKLFKFENQRLDVAMRCFLDSFRLPGDAAEISKILQAFADHWYEENNRPFVNSDAVFTLAYAIIMLNMDQHNPQVRRNQKPMDSNAFKRNLSGTNGGENFASELLDEIYGAIKENEIIIPTEHSGTIRETHEWQILLKKSEEEEQHCKFDDKILVQFDNFELFQSSWGKISSTMFFVFDKSENPLIISKAMNYFRKCVNLSVRYGMPEACESLIIQLCKFVSFIPGIEALHEKNIEAAAASQEQILSYKNVEDAVCTFAENKKAQLALSAMLELIHANGDFLRESWKNVLDILIQLFRAQLLPTSFIHVEDFVDPKGFISIEPIYNRKEEGGFLSWLLLSNSDHSIKIASEKEELKKFCFEFVNQCHPENLIIDSKYLVLSSLNELLNSIIYGCRLINDRVAADINSDNEMNRRLPLQYEEMIVFLIELSVSIVLENKDRLSRIWDKVKMHFKFLLTNFEQNPRIPQRAAVGLLRITKRYLFRLKNEISNDIVEQSLSLLFKLHPSGLLIFSRDIAFGLHDILRSNSANLHEAKHWHLIITLLEAVGAPVYPDESEVVHGSKNESTNQTTDSEQII